MSELAEVTETTESQPETTRDIVAAEFDKLEQPVEQEASQPTEQLSEPEKQKRDYTELGFKKDIIPKLETLDDEIANALVERDSSYKQGLEKYKQKAAIADEFTRALEPHSEYLKALEVAPTDYIPALVSTEMVLRLGSPQQKAEMIHKLAHDYGIVLDDVIKTPFDPRQAQLQDQLAAKERELRQLQGQSQNSEKAQVLSVIEQWSKDKEDFDIVREDMAFLLESGKAQDLDSAYNMARRLNDDLFNKIQEKQFSEKTKAAALQANQLAKQAKAQAVQISGKSAGAPTIPELKSTQDAVRWAMSQHGL